MRSLLLVAAALLAASPTLASPPWEASLVSADADGTPGNNGSSGQPSLSADGRLVAFSSYASNLVSDDTNGRSDVFVRDRLAGVTQRVSVDRDGRRSDGGEDPSISADGRTVVFAAWSGRPEDRGAFSGL